MLNDPVTTDPEALRLYDRTLDLTLDQMPRRVAALAELFGSGGTAGELTDARRIAVASALAEAALAYLGELAPEATRALLADLVAGRPR